MWFLLCIRVQRLPCACDGRSQLDPLVEACRKWQTCLEIAAEDFRTCVTLLYPNLAVYRSCSDASFASPLPIEWQQSHAAEALRKKAGADGNGLATQMPSQAMHRGSTQLVMSRNPQENNHAPTASAAGSVQKHLHRSPNRASMSLDGLQVRNCRARAGSNLCLFS